MRMAGNVRGGGQGEASKNTMTVAGVASLMVVPGVSGSDAVAGRAVRCGDGCRDGGAGAEV